MYSAVSPMDRSKIPFRECPYNITIFLDPDSSVTFQDDVSSSRNEE